MRQYEVGLPMEEIAIDVMGPFLESNNGNKYVPVAVDSFSKWMEAYAVPNIDSKTNAEKLVMELISHFRLHQTEESSLTVSFSGPCGSYWV